MVDIFQCSHAREENIAHTYNSCHLETLLWSALPSKGRFFCFDPWGRNRGVILHGPRLHEKKEARWISAWLQIRPVPCHRIPKSDAELISLYPISSIESIMIADWIMLLEAMKVAKNLPKALLAWMAKETKNTKCHANNATAVLRWRRGASF